LRLWLFLEKAIPISKGSEVSKDYYESFGKKYENLTYYDDNGKIENSFKKGGENYDEEIGEINEGNNYPANERNNYDLYIPDSALKKVNESNGLILWIHGGAWIEGDKTKMEQLCEMYAEQGYITANMEYTLLNGQYKEANIYRIMDEITACIKSIKEKLKNIGFDVNKLKMVIGGYSAGAHLALLYSYLIKDINIIPIQFVINFVGPIGLHEEYFYKLNKTEPLENIENLTIIEQNIDEGNLVPIFPPIYALKFMNAFYGNIYTDEELNSMLYPNGTINKDNDDYKKMYDVVKYAYVTEIEDRHILPTLCIYGGKDDIVGVSTYAYLKQKADKDKRYLYLIYSENEGHMLIYPTTDDGKAKLKEIGIAIMAFLGKSYSYFKGK